MKSIGIITDSHSSISQEEAANRGIFVLPMPFYIDGECFYEGLTLSRKTFFEKMGAGAQITTSQPSPAAVMEIWDKALKEYEKILYMPISSGLSGSFETAAALAGEETYAGRVLVVDHGQVATPLHQMILDTQELIEKGYSAEEIKEILEKARERMMIYIGVQTLENLKRGGRITPAAAALGAVFNIKPVLKLETGKLDSYKKCHGFLKARRTMIEAMEMELETRFKEAKEAGAVHLLAASSASDQETENWVEEIESAFPGMIVMCDPLTLGVSCHTGQGALGIGCAVKPDFSMKWK
ncbi:DegV family protein [Lachnospiraceae bacterium 45-P1]